MSFKNHLINNIDKIFKSKDLIDNLDTNYFDHCVINEKDLSNETISIIMTTCNRSKQTYFTLKTISDSVYKNVQIIIVDDSTNDFIDIDHLKEYNLHIDFVKIKNKFWINPCVNYNLGFKFIKGGYVVIQNGEVCHIGDVLNYIIENVKDDEYHIFNVAALMNLSANDKLYELYGKNNKKFSDYCSINNFLSEWYHHHLVKNRKFHFLTALTKKTFDKIGGFDNDYCIGACYDDDDLVFKIITNDIKIIYVSEADTDIVGFHQWHYPTIAGWNNGSIHNNQLLGVKISYYNNNNKHLLLSQMDKEAAINTIKSLF